MSCVELEQAQFPCEGCPESATATAERCPVRWLFQNLGDKWTLPVLGALHAGPLRFSQILKTFPSLSERMLILTLSKLEAIGFVRHGKADNTAQPNAYMLTPLGRSLQEHLGALYLWMGENAAAMLAAYKTDKT